MAQDAAIVAHGSAPDHHGGTVDPDPGWFMPDRATREPLRHEATDLDAGAVLADVQRRVDLWTFVIVVPCDGDRSSGHHARGVATVQTRPGL